MDVGKNIQEWVEESRREYDAYDSTLWHKALFDVCAGGYVVVDSTRRKHVGDSMAERKKYAKEFAMARVFAHAGYRIETLREDMHSHSYDANINGIPAEFKRTKGANNIRKYAKKGCEDQNATYLLFQLDDNNRSVQWELHKLKMHGYKVLFFFTGEEKVYVL